MGRAARKGGGRWYHNGVVSSCIIIVILVIDNGCGLLPLPAEMENLGRSPLSVVLSYLPETDGTSFLLTKRRYAFQFLPVFRLPAADALDGLVVNGRKRTKRHKFVPLPVQDPQVMLERLNTRRIFKRRTRPEPGYTTEELAVREWAATVPRPIELLRFIGNGSQLRDILSTVLVSYPRSGNTLMRTLLERITGHVSGSDTRPDRNLSRELAEKHDLVGEGITHPSLVRLVKTHWPERTGNAVFSAQRAVLVVRNPYDAIDSYWNMNATCSHTKTLAEEVYDRFRDKFEGLVRSEIDIWLKFHEYWMSSSIPVLLVRYEDLVQNPTKAMESVLQFILRTEDLPTYWRGRIKHVVGASVDTLGSYKPRSGSGTARIGKALRKGHISEELLQFIHQRASQAPTNFVLDLGYDVLNGDFPNNFATSPPDLPDHLLKSSTRSGRLKVNAGRPVRPIDCAFGRLLQKWRHSVTNKDADPLPTLD